MILKIKPKKSSKVKMEFGGPSVGSQLLAVSEAVSTTCAAEKIRTL